MWNGACKQIVLKLNVNQMLHLSQFLWQTSLELVVCQRNVTQVVQFGQLSGEVSSQPVAIYWYKSGRGCLLEQADAQSMEVVSFPSSSLLT